MLVLALLLAADLAPTGVPPELPRHASEPACWGGRFVGFEFGQEQLTWHSEKMIESWSKLVLASGEDGHIEVEAEASGWRSPFDRDLSLRRAEQLKQALIRHGLERYDIEIRLSDQFGQGYPEGRGAEAVEDFGRLGRVNLYVSQASEFIAPGLYRHCLW